MIELKALKQNNISQILANAFVNDPLYVYLFENSPEREKTLEMFFDNYLYQYQNFIKVYATSSSLEGIMCVYNEGTDAQVLDSGSNAFTDIMAQLNFSKANEIMGDNYLVLDLLAVKPNYQGMGFARQLVLYFKELAFRLQKPGIVEIYNHKNISFYEHLGFTLRCTENVRCGLTYYLLESNI